jgi:hypothetical protein
MYFQRISQFNIGFKDLPMLLRLYVYKNNLTIRESKWLDSDYVLTLLDLLYFKRKLNILFDRTQLSEL